MATPALTLLLDDIEARLLNITTANGFQTDIRDVVRTNSFPDILPEKRKPYAVYYFVDSAYQMRNACFDRHIANFVIEYWDSVRDDIAWATCIDHLADLQNCLYRNPGQTVTDPNVERFGNTNGNILDVKVTNAISMVGEYEDQRTDTGGMVTIEVLYATQPRSPFFLTP